MGSGQDQFDVFDSRYQCIGHYDIATVFPCVLEVSAGNRFAGRPRINLDLNLMSNAQSVFVGSPLGNRTFKIFIDKEVSPDVVGYVVARRVEVTVTVDIFGDRPVLHLVSFTVRVVTYIVKEFYFVFRREQFWQLAVFP